jgi:hypothetical protein
MIGPKDDFYELAKTIENLNDVLKEFEIKFEPLKTNLSEEEKLAIGKVVGELMIAAYEKGKNDRESEEWEKRFYDNH